ncbi:hypothetical protein CTEN210_18636 [Chaetoceros tenuissimus]|uniref:Uncharacterized protein n=1 Tax=Chaetoceros tenuissimus TaxID=426638 RepID=A0AAD3DEZ0_9STRA|nr:hypothetical protein CTEN210_18636 [Chaetoceros tenuissimus]
MSSEVKKPLFKKVKKKKQFKKRKIDDDDEDTKVEPNTNKNNDEATSNNDDAANGEQPQISEIEKIQSLKKARKIKNQLRSQMVAKKIKLRKLKEADGDQEEEDPQVAEANRELKHRLEGNFAITGKSTNDEEGNVLTKKHKLAMEQYIQSQMKQEDDDGDGGKKSAEENGAEETKEVKTTSDLYAKLLEESNRMGSTGEINLEDVGSGGEVLGGTGIAEVILPVDQRLKAARETQLAAARYEQERQNRQYNHSNGSMEAKANAHDEVDLSAMLPTSFGSGPANNKRAKASKKQTLQVPVQEFGGSSTPSLQPAGKVLNKNITANVGSSYSQNFRLHNEEWIAKKKQENSQENRDHQIHEEDEDAVDSGRIGFEAKRGLNNRGNQATDGQGQRIQRAHDDIVYKKFITREKNKR